MTDINFPTRSADKAATTDGYFFSITDEDTETFRGKFKLRWVDSNTPEHTFFLRQLWKRYTPADRQRYDHPKSAADEAFRMGVDVRAFVERRLVDWEDVKDTRGKAIPFSIENAVAYCLADPWLFGELATIAYDIKNFRAKSKEEVAKN